MKTYQINVVLAIIVLLVVGVAGYGQADIVKPTLTELTPNEVIDVSKISFYRASYVVDLTAVGGDKDYVVDAFLVVDGARAILSPDAEKRLKEILGVGKGSR